MKILILCYQANVLGLDNAIDHINNLSSIYSYFFKKYLEKKNVQIDIKNINEKIDSINDTWDHCFILVNRGASLVNNFSVLRSKITGKIFTICESNKYRGKEDFLIHYLGKSKPRCIKVSWMADPEILVPQKDPKKIVILVDHKYYGNIESRIYKLDKTEFILKSLLDYKNKNKFYNDKEIVIKHIIANNVITINNENDYKNTFFKQGDAVPYSNIVKYYNECDIFINTHYESMGLTVLECSMSGALVLTFKDFLIDEFRKKVYNLIIDENNINWEHIFSNINHEYARKMVLNYNYENNINYIYENYLIDKK